MDDALIPGQWYLFTAPGGFTFLAEYVRPLGMGVHRFKNAAHMLNAGGLQLAQICRSGLQGKAKFTTTFPGFLNATPLWWADYHADPPW